MQGGRVIGRAAVVALLLVLGCGERARERQHAMMPGMGMRETAGADRTACPPMAPAAVTAGSGIFNGAGNCFSCHGRDGAGTAMAPPLHAHRWLKIDGSYAAIAGLVTGGVARPVGPYTEPMPARGGAPLSSAQVCAVAAYVYSLSH